MKLQLLFSVSFSLLTSSAFALPATDQATPQVKANHSVFGQTVAADGSDRTPQGQILAEGGNDRLKEKGLITQHASVRSPQRQTLTADGSDRTSQGRKLAEGGGDRVIKRNSALS
ncbi:hypothetical protein GRW89_25480 [Pseudomonas moraviensis]|uniref:hypothetical protein n=1 Tax=Pseudomonas TaxID=286 RepID=UPI00135D1ED9|nr:MULTISPECIES: hypothetical protein [Pseudomonas]MXI49869.1 hypothetical protein [Pseudomonas moraviensis]WLG64180.1 hypothetical protein PSH90_08740 [Pseudomonas sp. FP1762]